MTVAREFQPASAPVRTWNYSAKSTAIRRAESRRTLTRYESRKTKSQQEKGRETKPRPLLTLRVSQFARLKPECENCSMQLHKKSDKLRPTSPLPLPSIPDQHGTSSSRVIMITSVSDLQRIVGEANPSVKSGPAQPARSSVFSPTVLHYLKGAPMSESIRRLYRFGPFCLNPEKLVLTKDDNLISLPPKTLEALVVLVQHRETPLEKDELIKLLWPDTFVHEMNLAVHISRLRKLLGEAPGDHNYIITVPKRGYRFVAEVTEEIENHSDVGHEAGVGCAHEGEEENSAPSVVRGERTRRNRHALIALILLLVAGAIVSFRIMRRSDSPPTRQIRSIAVLPFKPFGVDNRYSELGLAMADALTTKLSNVREIVVRPTTVVLRAHSEVQDPGPVGRKLSVDAVLEGRIQAYGGRIRVSVQLIRSSDGVPLWAQRFDQSAIDTFFIQDSISRRVTDSLMLTLTGDEKTLLSKRYTQSDAAHLSYIRGRYFWDKRTPQDLKKAISSFNEAVDSDPSYALAYAGLADSYLLEPLFGYAQPKDSIPKAKEAALKALEIDNSLAEAHASLGYAKLIYDWDWLGAEAELSRSLALSPNYPTAHHWCADYLAAMGRMPEAITEMKRARDLDPLSLVMNTNLGWVLYAGGKYDEALKQLGKTLEMDRNFAPAHWTLGNIYFAKGMYPEAVAEFEMQGDRALLGCALAKAGRKDAALEILGELTPAGGRTGAPKLSVAFLCSCLGDKPSAFQWLDKAIDEREQGLVYLKFDRLADGLRGDPKFVDALRRIGLGQ